jgi:hypothetical protein
MRFSALISLLLLGACASAPAPTPRAVSAARAPAKEIILAATESSRFMLDPETVEAKYTPSGDRAISALVQVYRTDLPTPMLVMVWGCANGYGKIAYGRIESDEPEIKNWRDGGSLVYDTISRKLCALDAAGKVPTRKG